jgi:penicillin-binding protein 1C
MVGRIKTFLSNHKLLWKIIVFSFTLFFVGLIFHWFCVPRVLFDKPTSTVLFDSRGDLLAARIAEDGQWRFPSTDTLDCRFVKCLLNYEDRRFFSHCGVDVVAIVRAFKKNIQEGRFSEGASTLTMQVARMARGNQPRTLKNKLIEILWALDIELSYSKEEILKLYLSNAPFGGNIVGIDAASWRYFQRDLSRLSWAELSTLAVLPNSPALIHLGKNRESLKRKRDLLLKILNDRGVLSNEEYELSLAESLPEKPFPLPNYTPHLIDYKSKTDRGSFVSTFIDKRVQIQVQRLANDYNTRYRNSNHVDNIAVLVLDVESGEPLVYVGNTTNISVEASHVDIIQSERSPGSTLKPFLYAAMISNGVITPKRLIADTPLSINGFTPHNFNKNFSGAVQADEAIIQSLNVPLVRMLSLYTVGRFMEDLKWLGMKSLRYDEEYYGASLILGGAEVSLWDLCQMYRCLAYNLKEDCDSSEVKGQRRISRAATWFAFEAMSKLNRPEEESEWRHFSSMKNIAWKTGTSWGSRDAWSVGVTPKYIVGVWVGNATGEGRAGMTGVGFAAPVMFDVFSLLDDSGWFSPPYGEMEQVRVCKKSGYVASTICEDVSVEYLPESANLTSSCPFCQWVHLSKDGRWQLNSSCVSISEIETKPWFVLPAAQEYYYKYRHADYRQLPPFREDCEGSKIDQIDLIYPEHNMMVVIPRGFDGSLEKVVCEAVSRRTDAVLYWHLDQQFVGETGNGIHQIALAPSLGEHILSVVDDLGNRKTISFEVK